MAASTDKVVSTCVDSYGSAIGMPQLCGDWMANQIFWLIVTLVIIFLILSRTSFIILSGVLAPAETPTISQFSSHSSFISSAHVTW